MCWRPWRRHRRAISARCARARQQETQRRRGLRRAGRGAATILGPHAKRARERRARDGVQVGCSIAEWADRSPRRCGRRARRWPVPWPRAKAWSAFLVELLRRRSIGGSGAASRRCGRAARALVVADEGSDGRADGRSRAAGSGSAARARGGRGRGRGTEFAGLARAAGKAPACARWRRSAGRMAVVRVWAAGRVVAVARAARAAAVAALVGSAPPAGARERGFGCGGCDARASARAAAPQAVRRCEVGRAP